jgi:hypothetical protein
MLVYCWLKRSVPVVMLLAVIACSTGLLKPLIVASSAGGRGGKPLAPLAAGSLATAAPTTRSEGVSNRAERPSGHRGAARKTDDWVRTRTGWEHEAKWFATASQYEPTLHPAVIAALIGLMAVWTLVAFPDDTVATVDEPDTPSPSNG